MYGDFNDLKERLEKYSKEAEELGITLQEYLLLKIYTELDIYLE